MVNLLDKYFEKVTYLTLLGNVLAKGIEINNEPPDDYFYIDVYHNEGWEILLNYIRPRNEEAWVIALKQLVERVHLEW